MQHATSCCYLLYILFILSGLEPKNLSFGASLARNRDPYVDAWSGQNEISDNECVRRGCHGPAETRICTTKGCVKAAARLLNSMDETVDPCDNFFQYACGQYAANHPIPDDKSGFDIFDELVDRVRDRLKTVLESDKHSFSTATHKKTRNAYKACINLKEIEKRGVQPGLDLLRRTNIWPVVQPKLYNENSYNLPRAVANIAKMGNSALIAIGVDTDAKNPLQYIISINQAALGMPSRDYLLRNANDTTVQAYYRYMLSVAAILDVEKPATSDQGGGSDDLSVSRARIESQLPAVLDFEIALATITTPKELTRDPVRAYNKMTLAELQLRVPEFNWLRFVSVWLEDTDIRVNSDENVIIVEPEYLMRLFELLERTPLLITGYCILFFARLFSSTRDSSNTAQHRTVANYLGWRTIQDYIFNLDTSLQEARLTYLTALSGISKDPPRYASCVRHVTNGIPLGVARLYVDNEFDQQSKQLAASLISNVRAAFDEQLDLADWLGQTERKRSHEKLAAILDMIGYDDRLLNDTWLDENQRRNVGNETDFFGNTVQNNIANVVSNQYRLREPVDRSDFDAQAADVNAFYNPTGNSIKFLAGMLQPPFFDRTQPMSLNFGGIGSVMGHEITHGFDDEGRLFDKNGLLDNWWKTATVENFLNRSQCVVNFFNNITVEEVGLNLNGQFTLGENLADLGGLNAAYRAHQNWLKEAGGEEPFLPGLQQFSNKQLFFLGAATGYCTTDRPEALKQSVLTDPHSPDRFRVNEPMANMPEFASAFNCPVGSRMNPVNKCRVW